MNCHGSWDKRWNTLGHYLTAFPYLLLLYNRLHSTPRSSRPRSLQPSDLLAPFPVLCLYLTLASPPHVGPSVVLTHVLPDPLTRWNLPMSCHITLSRLLFSPQLQCKINLINAPLPYFTARSKKYTEHVYFCFLLHCQHTAWYPEGTQ